MVEKFFNSRTVRSATDIFSGTQSFSIRFGWFRPLVSHKRKKNFVPAPCQHQFLQVNRNFELTLQQPHNDNNFFYFWKAVNSKSWFSKKLHQKILTGWPKYKFAISNGYNSENPHFWPHVGKAKMCFGGLHLFSFFSCLFTIFSCLFTIFKNKCRHPKHILALPTWGEKYVFSEL